MSIGSMQPSPYEASLRDEIRALLAAAGLSANLFSFSREYCVFLYGTAGRRAEDGLIIHLNARRLRGPSPFDRSRISFDIEPKNEECAKDLSWSEAVAFLQKIPEPEPATWRASSTKTECGPS